MTVSMAAHPLGRGQNRWARQWSHPQPTADARFASLNSRNLERPLAAAYL